MPAVLCDLDGLLVDTEGLHYEAYKIVLADYGIELTLDMFIESWLSGKQYGTRHYLQEAGVTGEEELIRARTRKSELFCELSKGRIKFMPGAHKFLEKIKDAGIACAVGTGGYQKEYEFSAQAVGLDKYVQIFVGGDNVEHNKPAPDIYLKAAGDLGVLPDDCVVFENSDIGMKAGLNAGMRCIVVPSEYTKDQDFTGATAQFESLAHVDLHSLFA